MADNYDFCLAQAEAARKSADAATLDNVRENFERAEKTWMALATKAQRVSVARVEREEASAARVAAANENVELDQAGSRRTAAE